MSAFFVDTKLPGIGTPAVSETPFLVAKKEGVNATCWMGPTTEAAGNGSDRSSRQAQGGKKPIPGGFAGVYGLGFL
ncbi:hypothetical protein BUE76_21530 [Cnuella takakiae]|nr:hypothetical protein BUE76_21530 [Cnuella takakiae]